MDKYRVFGYYNHAYYTIIQANSGYEAYEKAKDLNTNDWYLVEEDMNIYPSEVYLEVDSYDPKAAAAEYYATKDEIVISSAPEIIS